MIQENEIIMLALGLGVLVFIVINRRSLRKIPCWNILLTAYCTLLTAWISTTLESFVLSTFLNFIEHLCYLVSMLTMAYWCRQITRRPEESRDS